MRQIRIFVTLALFLVLSLLTVVHGSTETPPNLDKLSWRSTNLRIEFEDNRLTAAINGATLKEVVQVLAKITDARFVLVGDAHLVNQVIFAQVDEELLEKALARILRSYSYAVVSESGSGIFEVTIVLENLKGIPPLRTALSDADVRLDGRLQAFDKSAVIDDKNTGDNSSADINSSNELRIPDDVPRDLDAYMPLPDKGLGDSESESDSAVTGQPSPEEQAVREAAKLERSLKALNSGYTHLRPVAIEELAGTKDPLAVSALESIAKAADASDDERRQAAQALLKLSGDL